MRVVVTGASRGIGAAVARAFAKAHGSRAVIGILGRSHAHPSHPRLAGTLLDTARYIEDCGATAIPVPVDLADADVLKRRVRGLLSSMGGLDVLVNNASAFEVKESRMDLLYHVNTRATLLMNAACRDALNDEDGGSIVTLSPPVRTGRLEWISPHPAYTLSKYSMTLATLACATDRVRANCLWPRYTVATAATRRLEEEGWCAGAYTHGRAPDEVAKAIHSLATVSSHNAAALYDDEVIAMPPTHAPLDAFADHDASHLVRVP